jgi:hypothetical protein
MSLVRRTPPIGTTGTYRLIQPWTVDATKIYICKAVRLFADLEIKGIDVLALAYTPVGGTPEQLAEDQAAGAAIISLFTEDGTVIYVPDTRIESYPNMGNYNYRHVVASISLGAIPDSTNLDWLLEEYAELTVNTIGVTADVKIHEAPTTKTVTPEEHDRIEAARLAKISNQTTYKARCIKLETQVTALQSQMKVYEELLRKNNIL